MEKGSQPHPTYIMGGGGAETDDSPKKVDEMLDGEKQQMFTACTNPNVHRGRPGHLEGQRGIKIWVCTLSPCININSAWQSLPSVSYQ